MPARYPGPPLVNRDPLTAPLPRRGTLAPVGSIASPDAHGDIEVDVAVVGAGGAGLSLLVQLAVRGPAGVRVALVDPVVRRGNDRTWCFWDSGRNDVEQAVSRHWTRLRLVGPDGDPQLLDLTPLRYAMVRSADFYRLAEDMSARLGAVRVVARVQEVVDGTHQACVRTNAGTVRASWVFDSRPAPPSRPGATTLLQHFRGWVVRAGEGSFDPGLATLMDFGTVQPPRGLGFGYCLPLGSDRALVEYTEFSPVVLTGAAYDAALRAYLTRLLAPAGRSVADVVVEEVEDGVIPMTDAPFPRRTGRRVFRLGTSGGATRASTGYTFTAMQRQAARVAALLRAGRTPLPPHPYRPRHRWMDAVLLRALDQGLVDGPALLTGLFTDHSPATVLRFLDGTTTVTEDLAIMRSAPPAAMMRSASADAMWRARQRLRTRRTRRAEL